MTARLKNLVWIFVEKFGLIVVSFIAFYIFAKYLTADEYGLGVLSIAVVEFVGIFFVGLWNDPLVRRKDTLLEAYSSVFWIGGVGVVLLMSGFNFAVKYITENNELALLTSIASIKVLAVVLARPFVAQLRRDRNFKHLALRTLLGKILGTVVGITLAIQGFGALAVVSQIVVMELIAFTILIWGCTKLICAKVDFKLFMTLTREGVPIAIREVLTGSMTKSTIIIMGLTLSPTIIGYFAFANRLIELPFNALRTGLRSYVLPVMSKRIEAGRKIGAMINYLTLATSLLIFPVFISVAILAPPFITLLFDGKWDFAIQIFQFIAVLGGIKLFILYHGIALVALGKAKVGVWFEISNVAIALLLIYLLTPVYGLNGVVVALSLHLVLDFIIKIYSLNKVIDYDIQDYIKNFSKMLVSGFVLLFVLSQNIFSNDTGIYLSTVMTSIMGGSVYFISLFILRFDFRKNMTLALIK